MPLLLLLRSTASATATASDLVIFSTLTFLFLHHQALMLTDCWSPSCACNFAEFSKNRVLIWFFYQVRVRFWELNKSWNSDWKRKVIRKRTWSAKNQTQTVRKEVRLFVCDNSSLILWLRLWSDQMTLTNHTRNRLKELEKTKEIIKMQIKSKFNWIQIKWINQSFIYWLRIKIGWKHWLKPKTKQNKTKEKRRWEVEWKAQPIHFLSFALCLFD